MLYILEALFALAPIYVFRFKLAGTGSVNALEILILVFWVIFAVWLIKNKRLEDFWQHVKALPVFFLAVMALFAIAALVSAAISPDRTRALGQLIAFFIQPMLTFFPASYILREQQNKKRLLVFILALIEILALFAIIQYLTLVGVPKEWWGNANEPRRVLAVFEYPNAYALWLAPLLALVLPYVLVEDRKRAIRLVLGFAALVLTLSRGGIAGFIAAAGLGAFAIGTKNARRAIISALVVFVIIVAAVPNLRYRAILPFKGEKSAISRLSLWHTANKMISDSPLLGKGLGGFAANFQKYNTDPNLAPLNYPHNIFLNFWVETGLLGLLSFLLICAYKFFEYSKDRKDIYKLGVSLFLVALIVHGLVDAPYFKNDLALIFWVILAL